LLLVASLLQAKRLPIKTYTTADGLARDHILCIVQDSHGFLWFCTPEGLSRFDGYQFTNYHTEQSPPPVLVTGLSVGGAARAISDLGESAVSGLRLPQSPLREDYVGLGFLPGETLRYQYMLEGADASTLANGDQPITATYNGVATQAGTLITIQH
jgi:hypothetical protein